MIIPIVVFHYVGKLQIDEAQLQIEDVVKPVIVCSIGYPIKGELV